MNESSLTAPSLSRTALFNAHQSLNARIVDFGGWALPVNYGSQIDEHHAVRNTCGVFDVSHMTVSDLNGQDVIPVLRSLLANDIDRASSIAGKALYSCMLNEQGGVIDDLIVYRMSDTHCRLITNASTNQKDMAWINEQIKNFNVNFTEQKELALIAVQGPKAIAQSRLICAELWRPEYARKIDSLQRFQGCYLDEQHSLFVGRTGYTGEDGLEFVLPPEPAHTLWAALIDAGIRPCGLGARDTLRLEAGMSLYGNDLDEMHTPIESGIAWSVVMNDTREFIGKSALEKPAKHTMIGITLLDKGVLRSHQRVMLNDTDIGEITSGTFSPTLEQSIALARVNINTNVKLGDSLHVQVRNKQLKVKVVRYPFVKNGQATT